MTELVLSQADGDPGAYDTLILGIGNILWADEGFGIRSVETLHERYTFPEDVRVLDGGTQGIFLVPWVTNARRLLIFDAIDFGLEPGTLKIIYGADVPRFMGAKKMSMHQTGFQEVLAMADLTGDLPEELALVGVQPELLDDFGGSLTACVKAQIDAGIEAACAILDDWQIAYTKRDNAPCKTDLVGPGALEIKGYEQGRPATDGDLP